MLRRAAGIIAKIERLKGRAVIYLDKRAELISKIITRLREQTVRDRERDRLARSTKFPGSLNDSRTLRCHLVERFLQRRKRLMDRVAIFWKVKDPHQLAPRLPIRTGKGHGQRALD